MRPYPPANKGHGAALFIIYRLQEVHKARAFQTYLGYNLSNADELIQNVLENIGQYEAVKKQDPKGYGEKYIIDLEGVVYEEELINDATAYHFIKAGDDYYPSLAREDRDILDDIIDCFGESTKKEIVDAMHKEQAYLETAPNDIIQFKYAKQLSLN